MAHVRRRWSPDARVGAAALAFAVGACSQSTERPPPPGATSDASTSGDGAARDAAGAADADVAADVGATSDDAPTAPAACVTGHMWSTAPASPWESAVPRFGGISADELTVAWTVGSDGAAGPSIEVATRMHRSDAFGAPVTIASASIAPDDRVALDPSGNSIIAVASDRSTFVDFIQSSPGTWTELASNQFGPIASSASDSNASFYEPVLGQDGALYYVLGSGSNLHIYESPWVPSQHAWGGGVLLGTSVAGGDLSSPDTGHLRRPTGASADGLTLFFFDGVAGQERAAWRGATTQPFGDIEDLAAFAEAAPNPACDRLYFLQSTAGTASLFTAQ
jgi:hypothetical protein